MQKCKHGFWKNEEWVFVKKTILLQYYQTIYYVKVKKPNYRPTPCNPGSATANTLKKGSAVFCLIK